MPELDDKEIEIGGKVIGGGTTIRLTVKTLLWILGLAYMGLGYLYYDLRTEFKENNGISAEEKREFLKDINAEYNRKFEKMFDDISDIKGNIKVILDREGRVSPVQMNPNKSFQSVEPPPIK